MILSLVKGNISVSLFFKNKSDSLIIPCISTDGTKSIAYYSSKNKPSNKKNKNDTFTFLTMGMFNVTYNEPVLLKTVDHKNERKVIYMKYINK